MYKTFIKPLLFLLKPEAAHHFTFLFLKIIFKIPFIKSVISSLYNVPDKKLSINLFGLNFPNRIGLAAGFDKDARLYKELAAFGFGFIEIGTLTPKPQPGNAKPRLFRLPFDEALINRMGFNNQGVNAAAERLKCRPKNLIIGGNIGKNKNTPNEKAINDYQLCYEALYPYVDYFVLNVSSPNTPGLRDLQDKQPLLELISHIKQINKERTFPKPVLLKIAPDLTDSQLDDIIEIVQATSLDGIIATNTTILRDELKTPVTTISTIGAGGLSGKPLNKRSTEVIKYLAGKLKKSVPIIGVGGIHSPEDALEKLNAGADLIQLYTGFIYEGPAIVKKINKALLN